MTERTDMNRDPITGEPGSHPVGTGVGSAGGAVAGAGLGAIGGPIGMLVGGAIGAMVGAGAGHAAGEILDPTGEEQYWRTQHKDDWNEFGPAYKYGWESRSRMRDRNWDDRLENELREGWEKVKGSSKLTWDKARTATRNAWERTERTFRAYDTSDRRWRDQFKSREYYDKNFDYDRDYRSAYLYGTYLRYQYPKRSWDTSAENDFGKGWERVKRDSRLTWDRAKHAARDAWNG